MIVVDSDTAVRQGYNIASIPIVNFIQHAKHE